MRFLVDENLPVRFANLLAEAGHEADHVSAHGLDGHADEDIMALARRDGHVVVTYDADYSTLAVLSGETLPSIVLFRDQRHRPEDLAHVLLENLPDIEQSLSEGAIAVFDPARVRVRSLPIEPLQ